ncbi:MAG TPA: TIGR04442 family protein, partial [Thermodesulfobacteriota bacterium]|nr:TIGR04442 family protein [Thermodesulfobacteriota bacterium]
IPKGIMKRVFIALKLEIFYINEILPKIIETGDMKEREDFLHNSGLDRFYVEDIERKFLDSSDLSPEIKQRFKAMAEE